MNVNPENSSLHHKNRGHKNINRQVNPNNLNNTLVVNLKIVNTIRHLAMYDKIYQEPPKSIKTMNLNKLYKIISVCINKPTFHRNKPCSNIQQDSIKILNFILKSSTSEHTIHTITNYCANQIQENIQNLKTQGHKSKKSIPAFQACVFTNLGPISKQIPLPKILNNHHQFLPKPMNYITQPKIIYKNLPRTSKMVYNYIGAADNIDKNNKPKHLPCECLKYAHTNFIRDGHICTGNMNVIHELSNANIKTKKETINLLNKGTKHVDHIRINKNKIIQTYHKAVNTYTEKIAKYAHIPIEKFEEWSKKIKIEITYAVNKLTIKNKQASTSPQVKNTINTLKEKYIFTCIDKMPNNYCITCKKY